MEGTFGGRRLRRWTIWPVPPYPRSVSPPPLIFKGLGGEFYRQTRAPAPRGSVLNCAVCQRRTWVRSTGSLAAGGPVFFRQSRVTGPEHSPAGTWQARCRGAVGAEAGVCQGYSVEPTRSLPGHPGSSRARWLPWRTSCLSAATLSFGDASPIRNVESIPVVAGHVACFCPPGERCGRGIVAGALFPLFGGSTHGRSPSPTHSGPAY